MPWLKNIVRCESLWGLQKGGRLAVGEWKVKEAPLPDQTEDDVSGLDFEGCRNLEGWKGPVAGGLCHSQTQNQDT